MLIAFWQEEWSLWDCSNSLYSSADAQGCAVLHYSAAKWDQQQWKRSRKWVHCEGWRQWSLLWAL